MNRMPKRLFTLAFLALVAMALVFAFRPTPLLVDTAIVAKGPMLVTIDEDGQTRGHDRFTLTAPVSGSLSRISLHEGDQVARDALIALINPLPVDSRGEAEIRAQIAMAQALKREADQQAGRAETAHQQAKRDLTRADMLFRESLISREKFEEAQTKEAALALELEAARQHVNAAAAEVTRAEAGLVSFGSDQNRKSSAVEIRSPVGGRILRIYEKSEHVVPAGTPIVVISNVNKIEIVADLLSSDAIKVVPGAAVLVDNWGGDKPLHARVRTVEPFGFTKVSSLGIEEQRVNVVADFVDPPGSLGDGYRVDVHIVLWEAADVLRVPASALFRVGADWHVFVLSAGIAQSRRVEIDHRNALYVEIKNGLQMGETVMLHPSNDIKDGVSVKPRTQ